jgi:hypothetical protein
MPKSKAAPRAIVTPSRVLRLFMSGRDTADIASDLGIREHEAYRLLRISREAQRLFNDPNRDTLSPVHEQALEGH